LSNDPQDYGLKRYTDLEVAQHTIMLDGLPQHLPRRELEQKIKNMFKQIVGGFSVNRSKTLKQQRLEELGT
jgi:hypothetical protein